jgi:parallel beta-helix repeat protein
MILKVIELYGDRKLWVRLKKALYTIILTALLCVVAFWPLNVNMGFATLLDLRGGSVIKAEIDWWTMFRHDLNHTGYSTSKAVTSNNTIWTYTAIGEVVSSPAVVDDIVFVGSGGQLFDDDGYVYALNATTGSRIWNYTIIGGPVCSSPAVADGKVYIGSLDGNVYALDMLTGAPIWNHSIGILVISSPVVADGKVIIGSYDEGLYALDASNGTIVWNAAIGCIDSSPSVANGKVYVGSYVPSGVYALDVLTGDIVWNYMTPSGISLSSPTIVDNVLYIGSTDEKIYALQASDGTLLWNYTTLGAVYSSPAVADGIVYIGSVDSNVYALNATTGTVIWSFTTGGEVFSSPAVVDGIVYIGSNDSKLYALNASSGELIWSYTIENIVWIPPASSPAIADGKLFVGSSDGKIYAFGPPLIHDIATINVTASPTTVLQGELVTINVTVLNEGTSIETFNVTTMYGTETIDTKTDESLDVGASSTLTFMWNTTGVPVDSYLISAKASIVEGETDVADNELVGPMVKVVRAIYIRADGSIDPPTAPIQRVGNVYTLTSDINESIVIERDNITVDGTYHKVQGKEFEGLCLFHRNNVTVRNFYVIGFQVGIKLENSTDCILFGNTVSKSTQYGVYLNSSGYNRIYWNKATDIGYYGVYLLGSYNNWVDGNVITNNNRTGIRIDYSPNCTVSDNTVKFNGLSDPNATENFGGIWLNDSPNSTISGNTVVRNTRGIGLGSCGDSVVDGNVMIDNNYNFAVYGSNSMDFNIKVNNTSNIADGKRIYYEKNLSNKTIDLSYCPAATIYVIDSTNVTIKDLTLTNNAYGVFFWNTNNSRIEKVRVSNNIFGIEANRCSNITITGSILANNKEGLRLNYFKGGVISRNIIANNTIFGIYFYSFGDSIFSENDIINNTGNMGIYLASRNNLFFHNNIVDTQIMHHGGNVWDNGAEGNYWNDYKLSNGTDDGSGGRIAGDGIGDTLLPWRGVDYHPLMDPWSLTRLFNVTWKERTYQVVTFSNSTIASIKFNQTDKQISFKVTGPPGTDGFCNVTIPKELLNSPLENWTVTINGEKVTPMIAENATHTFIYLTFTHSSKTVEIEGTDPIDDNKPIANAGQNQIVNEDSIVTFNGSASWDDICIASYVWTFVDETPRTLSGVSSTYIFKTPGTYTIKLNVTDLRGNWDTDNITITVIDVTPPNADPGFDQTVEEDKLVTLDGSKSTDNVGIISYTWTFIDVTPQTLAGKNPTYIFQTPGIYAITLNVTDAAGNSDIRQVTITVLDVTSPRAEAGPDWKSKKTPL